MNNELVHIFNNVKDNDIVTLSFNKEYHVYQDDAFEIFGMYLSNTCTIEENPKGEKRAALYLKDKKNIIIDGNGAKIILHGLITPFIFENCKNLILKNFSFHSSHPTMSEILIKEKKDDSYIIEVNKDCLFDIKDNDLIFHSEKGKDGQYYWSYSYRDYLTITMFKDLVSGYTRTKVRNDDVKYPCCPKFKTIKDLGNNLLEVTLVNKDEYFEVNNVIEIRNTIRDQVGGAFVNCKNVIMNNCLFSAIHGFGILAECSENITYANNKVIPANGRVIACNADFFHFSCCRGNIEINNNILKEGHDDFINVHGVHTLLKEVIDEKTILIEFINKNTFGFNYFRPLDKIAFINKNTLEVVDENIVVGSSLVDLVTIKISLKKPFVCPKDISLAIDNATCSPTINITNNEFGPSMGRGILTSSRGKTIIKNNKFNCLGGSVLYIADDTNFWFESSLTKNIEFSNNVIIDCAYNPFGEEAMPIFAVEPVVMDKEYKGFVHDKLTISSNKIYSPYQKAKAFASYIKNIKLNNNISSEFVTTKKNANVEEKNNKRIKQCLLIGDSISYGEGADDFKGWAYLINNSLNDIYFINKAVRGYSAFNFKDTFEEYCKSFDASTVIVALGMNDSALMDQKDYEPLATFEKHLNDFVSISKKYSKKLLFLGPTPVDESRTTPISWSNNDTRYLNSRLRIYTDKIKEIASKNNCPYLDLSNSLTNNLLFDGVHPTNEGHKKLAKIIERFINKNCD